MEPSDVYGLEVFPGGVESGGSIPANLLEDEIATDMLKLGNNAANDQYTERCKRARAQNPSGPLPRRSPRLLSCGF